MKLDGYDFFLFHAVERAEVREGMLYFLGREKDRVHLREVDETGLRVQVECVGDVIGIVNDPPEIHVRSFERPESGIHIVLNARNRCQEID